MKGRVITTRLSEDLSHEIEFLKSSLNLFSTTSVVTQAIHLLYTTTKKKHAEKSSLQLFEESGLLGCMEGRPDLSTRYKEEISEIIRQKHTQTKTRLKQSKAKREKIS